MSRKGCTLFLRNDSFTSHVFLGTCFGSGTVWTKAMVRGVSFWRSRPGPQVWDCSAATFSSDRNTSLARKAWGGRTGLAKRQEVPSLLAWEAVYEAPQRLLCLGLVQKPTLQGM